jgi:hypothetical protein
VQAAWSGASCSCGAGRRRGLQGGGVAVRVDVASWTPVLQDSAGPQLGRQGGGGVCRAAVQHSDAISAGVDQRLLGRRAARRHGGRAVAWMQRCKSCRWGRTATLAGDLPGSSRADMRLEKESLAFFLTEESLAV